MSFSTSRHRPTPKTERRRWLDRLSFGAVLSMVLLITWGGLRSAPAAPPAVMASPLVRQPSPTMERLVVLPTPLSPTPSASPTVTVRPSRTPIPTGTPTPEPSATPEPPLVAIVVGHRGNDSGAICEGNEYAGLYEVHVTTDIATRMEPVLTEAGYRVMLLDEFDERMHGLEAALLLSLHVDSCVNWYGATGYKAARSEVSAIPEIEDELVACIDTHYPEATGLSYHPTSITQHMRDYHAFRKIDPETPAAIIELGFLYHDHELLTQGQAQIVEGLQHGIECFLRPEPEPEPSE